ncbi:MAG: glutathione S-transferase family protein [Rhizobiaceae bacterium]|nr:glutathione S-transferase family protein [Rhizobiaceae bacterium]
MTIVLYELAGADEKRPFSPHCWKTVMSLAHKGLSWDSAPTHFIDVPKIEGGVSKTVPVIRDGDKVISDSFAIALYLEETYPDRPSLFRGKGGEAMARFIERWSQTQLHPFMGSAALMDLYEMQDAPNKAYFRESREKRYGKALEAVVEDRDSHLDAFRKRLEPLRDMLAYQPFIGGQAPLYPDYIVFGAFQWTRIASPYGFLAGDDPVASWMERCLDLYDGLARKVPAAA